MSPMKTVGYVCVSTDKQAERGISLEAQKIRAMALVQGAYLSEIIVESGESAKSLNRPGMAKLDRLTRSVKDLCELLERFERRGVALVSVAESLDTGSAAGVPLGNATERVPGPTAGMLGGLGALQHSCPGMVWRGTPRPGIGSDVTGP
jgi:hypothetical protein